MSFPLNGQLPSRLSVPLLLWDNSPMDEWDNLGPEEELELEDLDVEVDMDQSDDGRIVTLTVSSHDVIDPESFVLVIRSFADQIDALSAISEAQFNLPN